MYSLACVLLLEFEAYSLQLAVGHLADDPAACRLIVVLV